MSDGGESLFNNDVDMTDEEVQKLLEEDEGDVAAHNVHNPDEIDQRILDGAKSGCASEKKKVSSAEELQKKIESLESEIDKYAKKAGEEEKRRREAETELEQLKKKDLRRKTKAEAARAERNAAEAALVESFKGADLEDARRDRQDKDRDELRFEIRKTSSLHPDYECDECGLRPVSSLPLEEAKGPYANVKFRTLRELAALVEIAGNGERLSVFEARKAILDKAHYKDVSANSLKKAYRKGMCPHATEAACEMGKVGVFVDEEEVAVSDALSQVLCAGAGRVSRKAYLVFVPDDSVISGLRGKWKKLELMSYGDDEELKKHIQAMSRGEDFPRNLVIVLKSTFTVEKIQEVKARLTEIARKEEITIYAVADILPSKPSELKIACAKSQQKVLTSWRLEKPTSNLVVISQISGLIGGTNPFVNLFIISRSESKELFEAALLHITENEPFSVEMITNGRREEQKRSFRPERKEEEDAQDDLMKEEEPAVKRLRIKRCFKCNLTGHVVKDCKKKDD